jgi:hypothetical protein
MILLLEPVLAAWHVVAPARRPVAVGEPAEPAGCEVRLPPRTEVWNVRLSAGTIRQIRTTSVSLLTSPQVCCFLWPLFGWGIGLAAQA